MKLLRFIAVFLLLFVICLPFSHAQLETNCENSNFSLGNWYKWDGCYGQFSNPCEVKGFLENPEPPPSPYGRALHKMIQAPGWLDANTCDSLVNVYPGELFTARIGDTSYSAYGNGYHKAAELTYEVTVTSESYLFMYRYAIVLENGGHASNIQPDFKVAITDADNNILDSVCGYYHIVAPPDGVTWPGWHSCINDVSWKDWTTVGMNLTPYVDQTIYITFKVRPCTYNTHFGYAYISASCGFLELETALCEGQDSAVLTAPPGFSYLWTTIVGLPTGDTTASITVPSAEGSIYECTLTAANGCEVVISNELHYTQIEAGFTEELNCAGRPSQFHDTTWVSQNEVVAWRWFFGDPTSGPADSSNLQEPIHSFTEAGTYSVTVISYSTEGCADTTAKQFVIDSLPDISNSNLRKNICSYSNTSIALTSTVSNTLFTWTAVASSADVTGFSDGTIPTDSINQVLVNSGSEIDSVTYTITPLNASCTGDDTTFNVLVYPWPVLTNNPLIDSTCSNVEIEIELESNNDSTLFTWICTASSGNLSGYQNNTTEPEEQIEQTLINSGYTIDTVYYHLVPQSYGCFGDTIIFKVVVYPVPDLSNSITLQEQCNGSLTGISLTSNVANTTFTWSAYGSSGNLSGYSGNSGPGTILINQTLVNSGYSIDTVTYRLLPTANGCPGDSIDYNVVIFPTPDLLTNPVVISQCNNLQTNIILASHVDSTAFTWRAFASTANITGFSSNTGPADTLIAQTLVNSGYTIDTVTYRLMPVANTCFGDSVDFKVAVYPTPDFSNNPAFQSQCNNQATAINLLSNVANTAFTWTCTQTSGNITGWTENPGPGATAINQMLVLSGYVTDSVIYHLTPIANNCAGFVTNYTVIVNPITELTVSPLFDSICSEGFTNINLTSTVLGTEFTWAVAQGVGNITGFSDGTGALISQQLFNPDPVAGSVIYTITPATTSCTGLDYTFTQWVKSLPHLSNLPKGDSICNNTSPNLTLTSDVLNSWFTWTAIGSSLNITGYSDQTTPTTLLNQPLINSGYVLEWVTYQVTPTAAGCVGPDSNYVITVYPVPDLSNSPLDTAICSGQPTGITLLSNIAGTLFTWTANGSSGNVTGFSDQAIPTDFLDQALTNSGYNIETVTYQVTPTANGCNGDLWTCIVTVYPVPDVSNSPMLKEICNNNNTDIDITSNVSGTLFTWTATGSSANITGFSNNPTPATHIGDNLVNLGDINETVTYHITPHANGCDGTTVDYIVTVIPSPVLTNNPPRQPQCNNVNTNIVLASNVAGTLFSWTCTHISGNINGYSNSTAPAALISQVLVNSSFVTDSVIYYLTPENSGCPGSPSEYTVVVFPVPDLYFNPTEQTVCEGETSNIQNLSHVTGTTFSWIATPSSLNLSGYSDGTGNLIAQTVDNNGATIEWVTYQVTPTANGCPPGTTLPVVLTVNPLPIITNPITSYSICNNTTTNITIQSDVTGATVAWRAFSSSTNITGFSDGSGFLIAHTLVNSGYTIDSVTYRIAATANSCLGDSTDINVVVFPVADVIFNPTVQELCSGQTTGLTLQSNVANTTYAWTATGSSPSVTGQADGSGDLIQQTLVNSGYDIETVTYQVTPTANGCNGDLWTYVVTVYPVPDVSNSPMDKEICNNNNTDIDITSNVSGTLFTWTATGSSANITGFSNNPTPATQIGDNLINLGDINETVTYHITPHANGCDGIEVEYVVTVVPSPFLTNTPLRQDQCNNLNTNLTLQSNVAGTEFSWTCTHISGNITGYSNSTAPGALISQLLVNSSFVTDSVIYHLTPENSGCPGSVTDYTIVVFPVPDLYFSPTEQTVCEGDICNIQNLSHVTGTTFSWTATPSSVNLSGYSDGTGNLIAQTIDNNGSTVETVTYNVTPEANGCPPGTTLPVVLTVNPLPIITNPITSYSICNNTTTNITIQSDVTGATVAWRAFSSSPNITGFSDGSGFLIAHTLVNSGYTIDSITYRMAAIANSCLGDSTDINVVVFPVADVLFTPASQELCSGETTGITLTSNVANTSYSWTATASSADVTGHSNGIGDLIQQTLVNSGYQIQTVTYEFTPTANGCNGDLWAYIVTVYPVPDVSNSPMLKEICNNNNTDIDLTSNVSGTLFTWTATGSSANITGFSNNPTPATHIGDNLINLGDINETVTYHITPHTNGCDGTMMDYVVTVVPSPFLTNSPLRQPQCNGVNTNIVLESNVAGTEFSWTCTQVSGNITGYSNSTVPGALISQMLTNSSLNSDSVIYHLTPENSGCPGSITNYTVVVFPVPDVYFNPNGETVCEGVTSMIQNLSHTIGATYSWTATASSPNLTGYSNGTGDLIAQTIDNAGSTIEWVTYQVTPTANGCPPGTTMPVILTVNPRPVVTSVPTRQSICNGQVSNLSLLADVPGSTFAWRAFSSSPAVTGFSDGSGFTIAQTLVNSGFSIDSVIYRVAGTANSCPGDSTDIHVVVFPVADVIFTPASEELCSGETTGIALTSNIANSNYAWTAIGSSPDVTGYSGGSGILIQQTLINSGFMIPTVTYQVTPTANGCTGTQNSAVVGVNPWPAVSLTICHDTLLTTESQPFTLKGGNPTGGIFAGPGVSNGRFFPALAGTGRHTITYYYQNTYGCDKIDSIHVTVAESIIHSCGDILIDIRDGQSYPTVQSGTQCWMATNLNFGNTISSAQMQRDNCVNEKYCYNDNPANCASYGGLYQWDEVMYYTTDIAAQGFCPPGWHIPTEPEWTTLFNIYISNGFAGNALKSSGYSGFNALMTGIRFHNSVWRFPANDPVLRSKLYWSSTVWGSDKAWAHGMNEVVVDPEYTPSVSLYPSARTNAFALRCLKD